jgi:hypothetical protein
MSNISNRRGEMSMANRGGHLYMQTNEIRNAIIHYHWEPSGTLTEVKRVRTGGAGSGTFRPISGEDSAPNAFEGAGSVILSPARRFLFAYQWRGEVGLKLCRRQGRPAHPGSGWLGWSSHLTGKNSTQGG